MTEEEKKREKLCGEENGFYGNVSDDRANLMFCAILISLSLFFIRPFILYSFLTTVLDFKEKKYRQFSIFSFF